MIERKKKPKTVQIEASDPNSFDCNWINVCLLFSGDLKVNLLHDDFWLIPGGWRSWRVPPYMAPRRTSVDMAAA